MFTLSEISQSSSLPDAKVVWQRNLNLRIEKSPLSIYDGKEVVELPLSGDPKLGEQLECFYNLKMKSERFLGANPKFAREMQYFHQILESLVDEIVEEKGFMFDEAYKRLGGILKALECEAKKSVATETVKEEIGLERILSRYRKYICKQCGESLVSYPHERDRTCKCGHIPTMAEGVSEENLVKLREFKKTLKSGLERMSEGACDRLDSLKFVLYTFLHVVDHAKSDKQYLESFSIPLVLDMLTLLSESEIESAQLRFGTYFLGGKK